MVLTRPCLQRKWELQTWRSSDSASKRRSYEKRVDKIHRINEANRKQLKVSWSEKVDEEKYENREGKLT